MSPGAGWPAMTPSITLTSCSISACSCLLRFCSSFLALGLLRKRASRTGQRDGDRRDERNDTTSDHHRNLLKAAIIRNLEQLIIEADPVEVKSAQRPRHGRGLRGISTGRRHGSCDRSSVQPVRRVTHDP